MSRDVVSTDLHIAFINREPSFGSAIVEVYKIGAVAGRPLERFETQSKGAKRRALSHLRKMAKGQA